MASQNLVDIYKVNGLSKYQLAVNRSSVLGLCLTLFVGSDVCTEANTIHGERSCQSIETTINKMCLQSSHQIHFSDDRPMPSRLVFGKLRGGLALMSSLLGLASIAICAMIVYKFSEISRNSAHVSGYATQIKKKGRRNLPFLGRYEVQYNYSLDGQEHTNLEEISFKPGSRRVTVHYDPANPSSATLESFVPIWLWLCFAIFSVSTGCGIWAFVQSLRKANDKGSTNVRSKQLIPLTR